MKRVSMLVVSLLVLTACGAGGSPPDRDGTWFVWLPDRDVDIPADDLDYFALQNGMESILVALGQPPSETSEKYLRPSVTMSVTVVGGDSPGITDMRAWLQCGAISRSETLEFAPPLGNSDGTVEADLGFVSWEGEFSGSERFSGTWTAGECEGSWNAKAERDDGDGGFFTDE